MLSTEEVKMIEKELRKLTKAIKELTEEVKELRSGRSTYWYQAPYTKTGTTVVQPLIVGKPLYEPNTTDETAPPYGSKVLGVHPTTISTPKGES